MSLKSRRRKMTRWRAWRPKRLHAVVRPLFMDGLRAMGLDDAPAEEILAEARRVSLPGMIDIARDSPGAFVELYSSAVITLAKARLALSAVGRR